MTYYEPNKIIDPVPVGLHHGWFGTLSAYDKLAKALATRGKPVYMVHDGRSFGLLGDINPFNYAAIPCISSKVAWAGKKLLYKLTGNSETDEYGHSMGGQTATNLAHFVASSKTDRFKVRSIVIDGSCGVEKHGLLESIGRARQFSSGEFKTRRSELDPRIRNEVLHYGLRNPVRSLIEGLNAGSTSLYDRLHFLGEAGVGRAAILSAKDIFSPADAVERDSRDVLDVIYRRQDPESGHLAPQVDAERTADAILFALQQLQDSEFPLAA